MLKRGILVVAVVAAALIGGAVWLFTRGSDSYATPEEAVLKTCHADPAYPPHDYSNKPPGGSGVIPLGTVAIVGWTVPGETTRPEFAVVQRTGGGKWQVNQCRGHLKISS